MCSLGSLACLVCQVALRTLSPPECLFADSPAPDLLVTLLPLRDDKYKRIFYMRFCRLHEATHFYIVNYDHRASIS